MGGWAVLENSGHNFLEVIIEALIFLAICLRKDQSLMANLICKTYS